MTHPGRRSYHEEEEGEDTGKVGEDVVAYLHQTGKQYEAHIELLRREQAMREAQQLPFQPRISTHARRAAKTSVVRQSDPIGTRLHELQQRKMSAAAETARTQERLALEEAAAARRVQPLISRPAQRLQRRGDTPAGLAEWDLRRRARLERRRLEAARAEQQAVSGTPSISAYAREKAREEAVARRRCPVEDHLLQAAEAQRQRRYAEYEEYSPVVSSITPSAAAASASASVSRLSRNDSSAVVDRLYRASASSPTDGGVFDEVHQLHCTFHPAISPASVQLSARYYQRAADAATTTVAPRVFDRLYNSNSSGGSRQHRRSAGRSSLLNHEAASSALVARPTINSRSKEIVAELRLRAARDGVARWLLQSPSSRLHNSSKVAVKDEAVGLQPSKQAVQTPRDLEEAREMTFAPAVNSRSERLWRRQVALLKSDGVAQTDAEARQLLWRRAAKRREAEALHLHSEQLQEESAACTFAPKAGRGPRGRDDYQTMPVEERATHWAEQRDRRLGELRAILNRAAASDCTFQPQVDPVYPLPRPDAALASGVVAHLERQEAARQQRLEKEQWWDPVRRRQLQLRQRRRLVSDGRSAQASSARPPALLDRFDNVSGEDPTDDEEMTEDFEQHWAATTHHHDPAATLTWPVAPPPGGPAATTPRAVVEHAWRSPMTHGSALEMRRQSFDGHRELGTMRVLSSDVVEATNAARQEAMATTRAKPLRYRSTGLAPTTPSSIF